MILAADLGSTNIKTAVFSLDGSRLGQGSLPLPYEIHTNSVCELSPAAIARTFDAAALAALDSAGVAATDIDCAAFTSQAQTFCVLDAEGAPCGPMIGWADNRGGSEADVLQEFLGAEFHRKTGWPRVSSGHLLSKALWWKNHQELEDGQRFVTLPSFLAMRLGAPFVLDRNLAAMTGLFSIPENDWWQMALGAIGLKSERFGRVVETGARVPLAHNPLNSILPKLRSVVFAGNDHTAGAVGCGCSGGRSVLTLGTAGVFYRFAGMQPGPYSVEGLWGPYPGGGFYELHVIPHACSALDWADEYLFGSVNSPRFVEVAMQAPPGGGGIEFDPDKWGSVAAWSCEGSREAMARAVLEGIADKLKSAVGDIAEFLPPGQDHEIVLLGGGSRLGPWVELLEHKLGCILHPAENDGLAGAAKLARGSTL
jgi:sugar (pentulose or hexulose) kinase